MSAHDELSTIAEALRAESKFVVATHENPDGDAIGSASSMEAVLLRLDKDVLVHIPHGAIPREYEFITPKTLIDATPEDIGERVVLCLDCGNAGRVVNDDMLSRAKMVVDVDHHADNTRFGQLNHVRGEAACTTQLVAELADHLDVDVDKEIGTPIFVGLVTDTGRFQYSNTTHESFELAARLVAAGVDTHKIFREVYESLEYSRLKLLARGLERAERFDDGRVVMTYLRRSDFDDSGSSDEHAEGIVDFLRSVDGAMVALLVRDLENDPRAARKGSLRTTNEDVDVSIIARSYGGGGHKQAAGFSTDDDIDSIIAKVCASVDDQVGQSQTA